MAKLLLLALFVGLASSIPLANFFPYGSNYAADVALPRNDDEFSGPISVSTLFFGVRRSVLYVNNNGDISFNSGVSAYVPTPFPVSGVPLIAPFWGDVDTRPSNGGYVWYSLRSRSTAAETIVNTNFPGIAFVSTYHFVATWDHVGYYNSATDKLNTFQCIIVGNNDATFVIFNYMDNGINWTYGSASNNVPAQVGFDAGDQTNYYNNPLSRTSGVLNLWKNSNIGTPGQFLYLVSAATIQPASPLLVNAPADVTYECGSVPASLPQATNQGACQDGTVLSFTESDATTQGTCPGTYTLRRTWTAQDKCSRTASSTQVVTVSDTQPPTISLTSNTVTYECGTVAPTFPTPTYRDVCGASTLTSVDAAITSCSGQSFRRTFTASDSCSHSSQIALTVNVADTTSPVLTIPNDISVVCGTDISPATTGYASASDTCTAFTITHADTGATTCPSTVTRVWTAKDNCGNTASKTQIIQIQPICGDGLVQGQEQCDPPGPCCSNTCRFASAGTTCRGVYDLCDVAEVCTGASGTCPVDGFQPRGTKCGEIFGMCDVALENSCTGTAAACHGPPAFPFLTSTASWVDFNVISFDGYTCDSGDVEGRLAAKNNFNVNHFTLGQELTLAVDGWRTFSLFVAGDASWTTGSLYPDGVRNVASTGPAAFAYVGGNFNAPDYLANRLLANQSAAAVSAGFDTAKAYYVNIQTQLSQTPVNAQASSIFTDGLQITCSAATNEIYHVQVDGATWNAARWFSLVGCKFNARWIVDITGTGDVTIQGQPFPAIVERVIYNVLGSGRTIFGNTGVAAHILAPANSYSQSTGVTYGILIAGNVVQARQNNKPNCKVFSPVSVGIPTLKPVVVGDTTIWVASLDQLSVGDRICIGGDCRIVKSGDHVDVGGVTYSAVTVDSGFSANHDTNSIVSAQINDPDNAQRSSLMSSTPTDVNNEKSVSSASMVAFSAFIAVSYLFV